MAFVCKPLVTVHLVSESCRRNPPYPPSLLPSSLSPLPPTHLPTLCCVIHQSSHLSIHPLFIHLTIAAERGKSNRVLSSVFMSVCFALCLRNRAAIIRVWVGVPGSLGPAFEFSALGIQCKTSFASLQHPFQARHEDRKKSKNTS